MIFWLSGQNSTPGYVNTAIAIWISNTRNEHTQGPDFISYLETIAQLKRRKKTCGRYTLSNWLRVEIHRLLKWIDRREDEEWLSFTTCELWVQMLALMTRVSWLVLSYQVFKNLKSHKPNLYPWPKDTHNNSAKVNERRKSCIAVPWLTAPRATAAIWRQLVL